MNYVTFANDAARSHLMTLFATLMSSPGSAFAIRPTGKNMLANLRQKCSSAGCFLTSLIGPKIRRRCPSINEHGA
jgi:hypothetical protein